MTDFGNVPVHNVRAECNDSAVESPLANCLEFDDGLGSTSCTTHAGLICGGRQIMEPYLDYTACMQP